ncbi:MAG: hypothetical protein BKP49_02005 [Treponema sp. CETP13]|nr:MAG: hypothetical protein BKP49_02005 [Treponema sp. CETP13]
MIYEDIADLFTHANSKNFEKLPEDNSEKGKFAKQFSELTSYLEAAKIQGFNWDQRSYEIDDEEDDDNTKKSIELKFNKTTYLILVQRYKELFTESKTESDTDKEEITFEIDSYITEIDTDTIDSDYMNTRFQKFLKILKTADVDESQVQQTLDELHKSFATLNQEEQKYAEIFLRDVQRGDAKLDSNKSFKEYIAEYQSAAKNTEIKEITYSLGLDESKLRGMLVSDITASDINDYGRFDELKESADIAKAKAYFEKQTGKQMPMFKVHIAIDKLLKDYITKGEYE